MRYEDTVILTDLDGTLFNSQGLVSAENRAAISEYINQGGLFGVATGREPHNARLHLPNLPMNAPSIVLNGAAIYDFLEDACGLFMHINVPVRKRVSDRLICIAMELLMMTVVIDNVGQELQ